MTSPIVKQVSGGDVEPATLCAGDFQHFMKNMAIVGGSLAFVAFGGGAYSLDSRLPLCGCPDHCAVARAHMKRD